MLTEPHPKRQQLHAHRNIQIFTQKKETSSRKFDKMANSKKRNKLTTIIINCKYTDFIYFMVRRRMNAAIRFQLHGCCCVGVTAAQICVFLA